MFTRITNFAHRILTRLFRVELVNFHCVSIVGGKSFTLSREYLQGAQRIQLGFTARWPLIRWRRSQPLSCKLMDSRHENLLEPSEVCSRETGEASNSRMVIEFPSGPVLGRPGFRLGVYRQIDGKLLREIEFQKLDADRLVSGIKKREVALFVQQSNQRLRCDRVHDQVQSLELSVSLELANAEHRRLLTDMGITLQTRLVKAGSPEQSRVSWSRRLEFDGQRFNWTENLGSASRLFGGCFGDYSFFVFFGDSLIASKPLQVTSLEAYRQAVRGAIREGAALKEARFTAVNHKGEQVALGVVADDFECIDVAIVLEIPTADPLIPEQELSLGIAIDRCRTGLRMGGQACRIIARGGCRCVEHLSVRITPELFQPGTGQYQISLLLDDRLLQQQRFSHKTRLQIRKDKARAIFDSLSLGDPQLCVVREGRREAVNDVIFETDERVAPVFSIEGKGFDDDVSMLKWRLRVALINEDSGQTQERHIFLRTGSGKSFYREFGIPLKGEEWQLPAGRYCLRLKKRDQCLTEFKFRILTREEIVPYTKQLVLQNLRAQDQSLFVRCGTAEYQNEHVPDMSDFMVPKLVLCTTGFNSYLSQIKTRLDVSLTGGTRQKTPLAELPVTLCREPLTLANLVIKVRGTSWASQPGRYKVVFSVEGREIACFPFILVSHEELLQGVRVTDVWINAEDKTGRIMKKPVTVRLSEHRAIAPAIELEVGILAPSVMFASSVVLMEDERVLMQTDFDLQLDEVKKQFRCGKVQLDLLQGHGEINGRRFTLVVVIGGEQKGKHQFTLMCIQTIANFEGQLTVNPEQLKINDDEYHDILRKL